MIPFTLDTNNKKGISEKNGQFLKNDRLGDKGFPRQNPLGATRFRNRIRYATIK